MKKNVRATILCLVAFSLLCVTCLVLIGCTDSPEKKPSDTSTDSSWTVSADAILLTDPKKAVSSIRYDIALSDSAKQLSAEYIPYPSSESAAFYHSNQNSTVIKRSLAFSGDGSCHYALVEKEEGCFAFFRCVIDSLADAERLCHLLLCYRDYFPMIVLGDFSQEAAELVKQVCSLSEQRLGDVLCLSANTQIQTDSEHGLLLADFTPTEKTLDPNGKMIALTYDDGPSEKTAALLDSLERNQAKATFFVNGVHVTEYPEVITRAFSLGCEIGNHTNLHELFSQNTPAIIRKTVEDTNKKLRNILMIGAIALRPPGGSCTDRNGNQVAIGYPLILWNVDTLDYTDGRTVADIVACATQNAKSGDIVLMHDTQGNTVLAADEILAYLKEQQIQTVTVSELLEFKGGGIEADRVYRSATANN